MNQNTYKLSGKTVAIIASAFAVALIGINATRAADEKKADTKNAAPAATAKPALTVTTTQASSAEWALNLGATGNVAAWQEASLGAELSGLRLTEVRVNVGDEVKRGQVLAIFAGDTIQAELAQQVAGIAEAQAALADAQSNAERARSLQDTGALPAAQISQYLTAEKTALARLNALRAAQSAVQLRLGFTRVIAPDAGVISARMATVGAVVAPGQELFRLIRNSRLEWRGEVSATELAKISVGQKVAVTLPNNSVVNGKVRVVAPTVDPQTRNALVYVDLERHPHAKAGMFARGDFSIGGSRALSLPQQSIVARDGFNFVMRVEGSKVVQRKVNVGRRQGDRVEVLDGVAASDQIVATGAAFLSDGDVVRIVAAAAMPGQSPASSVLKPAAVALPAAQIKTGK